MTAVSPLAPKAFPELAPIAGMRLAAFACGIRYTGRDDLMLAELAPGGTVRGIVVNSGNSNVFTGRAGKDVVVNTAATAARLLACDPKEIFISSTGVIG